MEHQETVEGCRTCKFASIQISPAATPSKPRKFGKPREPLNSWEKGTVKDERGVPLLGKNLEPISVKEYGENRHALDARVKALKQGAPTTTKG